MEMGIRQSERIACLPGRVDDGGWSSDTQEHLIWALDSSVTVLRRKWSVRFALIWIGIHFWKCDHGHRSSWFSSPIILFGHQLQEISPLVSLGVKVSCFAFLNCNGFANFFWILQSFCLDFSSRVCINFETRISVWDPVRASCSIYWFACLFL